ncbi:TetR/AcrR family transcriptional regulator [Streptoalloteichus hindustanus]|uniref:Transcriptional regulator, TetR family n=1 Tax=Streptoalloteichus hindustanus TaxID=2017 RepID=A0A1M4UCF8_STRHI|nr:TetR family transcriptional regulator C-terminal domain-containing protein [Streptoalloteichus hindustanus]SHE54415.1 transcriptional regulator, TetR family [Streptoalloteichus hindustanus]
MSAGSPASTPKGERRRQALVEAAARLLVEGGFDAVRHRAVAERAGLPLASTTYYFRDLDDLVAAAAEHHGRGELARGWAQLAELTAGRRDVDGVVEIVLDQLLGPATERDAEAVVLRYERLVATGRRPHLRPLMSELSADLHELLLETLARCGIPADHERVNRLVALVDGSVVNALIEVHPDPRGAARRMLHSALAEGL